MCAMKRLTREELPPDLTGLYDECLREAGDARLIEVGANAPELLDWYFNSFYKRVFYRGPRRCTHQGAAPPQTLKNPRLLFMKQGQHCLGETGWPDPGAD